MKKLGCVAAVGMLLAASSAGAQSSDTFRNSWFWGAKAGVVSIGTTEAPSTARPTVGLDWLITRSVGGLYVSTDYTNVEMHGSVADPSSPSGRRLVRFNNLRRAGFAALAFPRAFGAVRPYAGVGLSINVIARAEPVADTLGGTVSAAVVDRANDARSRSVLQGMVGAQMQLSRVAVFGQLTMMPSTQRFLVNEHALHFLEGGVRYNFGPSTDRTSRGR
jgi:hypothetical protein